MVHEIKVHTTLELAAKDRHIPSPQHSELPCQVHHVFPKME